MIEIFNQYTIQVFQVMDVAESISDSDLTNKSKSTKMINDHFVKLFVSEVIHFSIFLAIRIFTEFRTIVRLKRPLN